MAKQNETAQAGQSGGSGIMELRQVLSSLAMRGHYKECFKMFEDNIKPLYLGERWPENFFSCLLLHKRCSLSMDLNAPYEAYLTALLQKNGIPAVLAEMARGGGVSAKTWRVESLRELALSKRAAGDLSEALDYADLMVKTDPLNSGAIMIRGWILQDMNRIEDAATAFERALELSKANYQASTSLAELYLERNPQKALDYVEAAIRQLPDEASFQALKGRILFKAGDLKGAIEAYDAAIALDPLAADYAFQKAEILMADGQAIAASREYSKALAVDSTHLPALERLASLLADTQPELALSYVVTVTAARPENRDASLLKARLLKKTGQLPAAIRQYKSFLELDPSCHEAYGELGDLYLSEYPSQALSCFERAVELAPKNARYRLERGRANEETGSLEAALSDYRQAVELDKSSAPAHAALGRMLKESDPKISLRCFDRAIALDAENSSYYQARAELLLTLGRDSKEAAACYANAVRYNPLNARLRMSFAVLLEKMGNWVSAVEQYRAAAGLDPDDPEAFHGLARLLRESEPDEAMLSINKAIGLDASRSEFYYIKARVYLELGRDPEALSRYRHALAVESEDPEVMQEFQRILDGKISENAMLHINRAIEMAPGNAAYLCVRAGLLLESKKTQQALEQYRNALKSDPDCHEAFFGQGRILASEGNAAALDSLDRAIALCPGNTAYLAEKADFLARDPRKYKQAMETYDAAIALDRGLWQVMLRMARLHEERGYLSAARNQYRRVLLVNPDCVEAYDRMGILLSDLHPAGALIYAGKAAELGARDYRRHIIRAGLLYVTGDTDGAETAVREALSLDGDIAEVYRGLAQALEKKLPEVALEYCEKAAGFAPGTPDCLLLSGDIHRRLSQPDKARECYAEAIRLNPGSLEALVRTAELLLEQGDPECLDFIDRALEQDSDDARCHYLRACILDGLKGRTADAIQCVEEALKLRPGDLAYRKELVALLKKKGARIRGFMEKWKLDELRRERAREEELAFRE